MQQALILAFCFFASSAMAQDVSAMKPVREALDSYLDRRFQSGEDAAKATNQVVELCQKYKQDVAAVEKLLREGRVSYPLPPVKGKVLLKKDLVCDYVDYSTQFYLYVPQSYDPAKASSLMIVAHGGNGAMSMDYARQATAGGIGPWIPVAEKFGFIVAAPFSERGWMTIGDSIIQSLLSRMQRELHIDADRVYLTGHSMGGHLTFRSAIFMPDRWAAVSPMSGGYDYVENGQAYNMWNVPGYATFGKKEPYKIDEFNRKMRDWMKERGYPWTFAEKDGGHEIFKDELPRIAQFFVDHPRNLYRPVVYAQRNDGMEHTSADANPKWNKTHKWKAGTVIDRSTIHWLQLSPLPAGTPPEKTMQVVRGEISGPNQISITSQHARKVKVLLHPKMVDFSKPVVVKLNGKVVHEAVVTPDMKFMLELVRRFDDRGRIFHAALQFDVESDEKPAEPRLSK